MEPPIRRVHDHPGSCGGGHGVLRASGSRVGVLVGSPRLVDLDLFGLRGLHVLLEGFAALGKGLCGARCVPAVHPSQGQGRLLAVRRALVERSGGIE